MASYSRRETRVFAIAIREIARRGCFADRGNGNGDGVLDIFDAVCTASRRIEYFLEDYGTFPGDADGMDGVAFSDFLILNSNFGRSPAVYTDGDFDMDGQVGFSDFLVLSGNYGQGGDFTAGATAAVPEPSSLILFCLMMVTVGLRSRHYEKGPSVCEGTV